MLTQEQRTKLRNAGYSEVKINAFEAQKSIKETEVKQQPSYVDRLKESFGQRKEEVQNIRSSDASKPEKILQEAGQVAGGVFDLVAEAPGIKQGFDIAGKGIQKLSETKPIKAVGEAISPVTQKALDTWESLPENVRKDIEAGINVASLIPAGMGTKGALSAGEKALATGSKVVKTADEALNAGLKLKKNVQVSLAKKSVNPQLESSANRLFLKGTKNLETPVATYEKYLTQSKKAIGDIKADPAISAVGEKMGKAFEKVIKQRKSVGEVLGNELKAQGNVKINIVEPKASLLSELADSGLSYNPKTNRLTSFQGSKFANDEVKMLNEFVRGYTSLGENPSVSMIDNFIAKTRSNLAFTKGKSGVTGTTNAERIINGGLSKLRASLDPAVNGNKALSKYWNANKTYSELSDFVDEGSSFLGKKTVAGDFAKDASVAKSSVQSILNQGKKDFMIKLEALTGYKAIDDAVLALQAMKDAGDFRGLSLLQAMSETGIPTSATGVTQKVLDYALSKGAKFIAGTPEEQTRALLQSLEKSLVKPTTIKPASKIKPKAGAKINRSTQTKSSKTVISKSIPKPISKVKANVDNPLITEARKYKSAEEFVKAQGETLYHGTPYSFNEFKPNKVTFFTPDKSFAEQYGADKSFARGLDADVKVLERNGKLNLFDSRNPEHIKKLEDKLPDNVDILGAFPGMGGAVPKSEFIERLGGVFTHDTPKFAREATKVGQVFDDMSIKHEGWWRVRELKKDSVVAEKIENPNYAKDKTNIKVYRTEEFPRSGTYQTKGDPYWKDFEGDQKFLDAVQSLGFDGFKMTEKGKVTYGVFNPEKLLTKSQLTDIWKKANQ